MSIAKQDDDTEAVAAVTKAIGDIKLKMPAIDNSQGMKDPQGKDRRQENYNSVIYRACHCAKKTSNNHANLPLEMYSFTL